MIVPGETPRVSVILLDRVSDIELPDYCIHGRTRCLRCNQWLWLGNNSHDLVMSGQALPLCLKCSDAITPTGTTVRTNITDHRRADGPHE